MYKTDSLRATAMKRSREDPCGAEAFIFRCLVLTELPADRLRFFSP